MIRSMTGFGNGKARSKKGVVTCEIKTVNHKFLEISCKLPNSLSSFEDKIKEVIQKSVKRGKVYLNLNYEGTSPHSESLYLDIELAKSYFKKLKQLKKTFSINDTIHIQDIVSFPGVLIYRVTEKEVSTLWPVINSSIKKTLARLISARTKEGTHLSKDLNKRRIKIATHIAKIEARSYINVRHYKKRLEQRIKEISGMPPANNDRLEMEVALYAKNSDISEEITRLTGHVINFESIVKKGGEAGKKLDFVAQEMHREANTIGSKSSDYTISRSVIEMKSEIEKIREQVKNLE